MGNPDIERLRLALTWAPSRPGPGGQEDALSALGAVAAALDAAERDVAERMAVNVGLIAENADLKRRLATSVTASSFLSDPDDPSGASAEGNDAGGDAVTKAALEQTRAALRRLVDAADARCGLRYPGPDDTKAQSEHHTRVVSEFVDAIAYGQVALAAAPERQDAADPEEE